MTRRFVLGIINLAALAATVTVSVLAVILPINNKTTEALADAYPNLFVPVGLTFSIWGVIYLLLAVFCVYSLAPQVWKTTRGGYIDRIGWLFVISCLLNSGWIFAWHYELVWLSVVIMLALLTTLIAIYLRLDPGRSKAPLGEKYLAHMPFSVYLGWISVATIANITAFLVSRHWNGFGASEQFWAVAIIAAAIFLAVLMLARRRDIYYALVIAWALLGIMLKRLADDSQPDQYVSYAAIVGMGIITAGVLFRIFKRQAY